MFYAFPLNLSGDCQISSVGNFLLYTCQVVYGVLGEVKSVSWGGSQTKGEVHKRKLTKNMFLHGDLLTSLTSSQTPLFFTIRKVTLQTNEIKIYRASNQSNLIIQTYHFR